MTAAAKEDELWGEMQIQDTIAPLWLYRYERYIVDWSMCTYTYIRRPLLVRGHQAARSMRLITVKVSLLSAMSVY